MVPGYKVRSSPIVTPQRHEAGTDICLCHSDDKDVDVLIKGVQIQGCRFSEAIDLSRNTSEDGLKLLGQSVLFARARANGKPIEDMQPDFGSLVRLASDGCEGSEKSMKILGEVYGRFREVSRRTKFCVIT